MTRTLPKTQGASGRYRVYVPGDFTVHTVPGLVAGSAAWAGQLPGPRVLPADLVDEGRAIPVARVQAMHEGKRRARTRRSSLGPGLRPASPAGIQRSLTSCQEGENPFADEAAALLCYLGRRPDWAP